MHVYIGNRVVPFASNLLQALSQRYSATAASLSAYRDWHLQVPQGQRTEACLRNNISVGVQYLEAWLGGMGCVPLHNLMEDAATAEIGRTQVWQWIHHKATLDDKDVLTVSRFNQVSLEVVEVVSSKFQNVFA